MQKIGEILDSSKGKDLVLKTDSTLEFKEAVDLMRKELIDEKREKVGAVKEVFGPVKNPYLSIKPEDPDLKEAKGKKLYLKEDKK